MRKCAFGVAVLTGIMLATSVAAAAPSARAASGRGRAIDLLAEGQAREAAGDPQGAIEFYTQSVQLAPSPAGYYHLGHAYAKAGDKDNARRYLSQALELNPTYELAKSELAALSTGKKNRRGGGPETASRSGGTDGAGVDLSPVAQEFPSAAALSESSAHAPINVDAIQREYATLRSLRRPDGLGESVPPYPTSASPEIVDIVPPGPAFPGAGSPPAIIAPVPHPTPAGTARRALEPQVPGMIVNEDVPQIIINNPPSVGPALGAVTAGGVPTVAGPRGVRATPEAGLTPRSEAPVLSRGQAPLGDPSATNLQAVGLVPLDPELPPPAAVPAGVNGEVFGTDGGAAPSLAAGGEPSVADINAAAFGEAAQAQKPSTGYNSPTKVYLGTYAFHKDKGDSYRAAGRFADAVTEYRTALRLSPGDTEVRTLLGEMLGRADQPEAAQAQFQRAEAMAPEDPRVFYRQGNAFRDEGKLDQAISSYLKALSLDPDDMFTLNNLGVVYMERGEHAKAAARFKRVLNIDPNYPNALLNLGILYDDHLDDKKLALGYYERYMALTGAPRKGEVQRWMDAIRREQGIPNP